MLNNFLLVAKQNAATISNEFSWNLFLEKVKKNENEKQCTIKNFIASYEYFENTNSVQSTPNQTANNDWVGNGTGFFVDNRGFIATNYHVIKDAKEIEVEFQRNGQKQLHKAEVIQSDQLNDLAILKIKDNSFRPFTSIPYNYSTNVFALGYPLALDIMGTEIKFTDGKISSKTGVQGDATVYQISVPIQAGNSGGPLFDYNGNLIGVTSSGLNRALGVENVNYAIKSTYLKNLIDVLPSTLNLPNDKSITNKTLTEKIKILSDYVVLIRTR